MRLRYHPRIARQLADTPPVIRRAFDRKAELLAQNLQHPSHDPVGHASSEVIRTATIRSGSKMTTKVKVERDLSGSFKGPGEACAGLAHHLQQRG